MTVKIGEGTSEMTGDVNYLPIASRVNLLERGVVASQR